MGAKARSAAEGGGATLAHRIAQAKAQIATAAKPAATTVPSRPKTQEVTPDATTTPSMREIGGSAFGIWNEALLHRTYTTASRVLPAGEDPKGADKRNAAIVGLGLRAFRPADPVEAMIASQAMGLHLATMECLRLAAGNANYPDVASKLRRDAANLSRAMIESTEALQRRKGKGPQTIRVERVVVQDGGQAVVAGSVVGSGGALPASAPVAAALTQGGPAMGPVEADTRVAEDQGR